MALTDLPRFLKKIYALCITALLFTTLSQAQTVISGGIYHDTTWSIANSPFIISGTVFVEAVTLTIQPGVTVKFQNNARLFVTNNNINEGRIQAIGTSSDSILFTSNSPNPYPGIYMGITFGYNQIKSEFKYCNFQYADKAIDEQFTESLTIRNSIFKKNNYGLYECSRNFQADSCIFRNNTIAGIYNLWSAKVLNCLIDSNPIGVNRAWSVQFINVTITGNQIGLLDISSCTLNSCHIKFNQTGLNISTGYFYYSNSYIISSTFEYNQIGILDTVHGGNYFQNSQIRNNQYGIILKNYQWLSSVTNCKILFNQYGIVNNGLTSHILKCRIDSNKVVGIRLDSLAKNCTVANCTLKNNAYGMIIKDGMSSNLITKNTIENDSIGIELAKSIDKFLYNRICNNTTYSIKYLNQTNFDFSNNFWCTSDTNIISNSIFDGNDSAGIGAAQFAPLDTSNTYLCNYYFFPLNTLNPHCPTCSDGEAIVNTTGMPQFSFAWNTIPVQTSYRVFNLSYGIPYQVCMTDLSGCTQCESVYFFLVTSNKGLEEIGSFKVFPNPFSHETTIKADAPLKNASLCLENYLGQKVLIMDNLNENNITLSRKNLASGLYFLKLTTENKTYCNKLIITDN